MPAKPTDRSHARAAASLAVILSAVTLLGCGAAHRRPGAAASGHRASAAAPRALVASPSLSWGRATLPSSRPAPSRSSRPAPSWLVDPDEPLPAGSSWWAVLGVAQRFAAADMSYEVGEVGPAVRWAITRTCTSSFATALLARRPSLPPGVRAGEVRQHVVGVAALERLRDGAMVLVEVRSVGRGGAPGAFELRLVLRPRGWRVAAITVV